MSDVPAVAIVGRPNVGKSTLFNRLIKRRKAIVQDQSGTTRDRMYEPIEWNGRSCMLIDTGGHKLDPGELISDLVNQEVARAINEASAVIFMVEKEQITSEDEHLAQIVKRSKKPVVFVVNKVDNDAFFDVNDLYRLGLGDPIHISSSHGRGVDELLDAVVAELPDSDAVLAPSSDFKLTIIGEPNAGKSTLLNALLKYERAIVSDIAGTTRDIVEEVLEFDGHSIQLIDTAGIKRKKRYQDSSAFFGLHRAKEAIRQSDLILLLFDATKGPQRDTRALFEFIEKGKKSCVIVVNKWDLMKETEMALYEKKIKSLNAYAKDVPMVFISALTGRNVEKVLPTVIDVWDRHTKVMPTQVLNNFLQDIIARGKLPRQLALKYMVQSGTKPPAFIIFINNKKYLQPHAIKYIRNQLIEQFGLHGVQMYLHFKMRQRK